MQDVKHNSDSLALMNVSVDFDELSIHVLNEHASAYSHISHALQALATPVTFEELFEHLLSYTTQMKISVPSTPLAFNPTIALVTSIGSSSHHWSNNSSERNQNRSQPEQVSIVLDSTCHLDRAILTSSSNLISTRSNSTATSRVKLQP